MAIRRWLVALGLLGGAAGAVAPAVGQVDSAMYLIGQWQFVPVIDQQAEIVPAFFAYYIGAQYSGDNLRAVVFERAHDGSWNGAVWPDADIAMSAAYAIARYGEPGLSILRDTEIVAMLEENGYEPAEGPEPDPLGLGLSRYDAWYKVAAGMAQPGSLLEQLRQAGHAITPELPAITARMAALESGDPQAIENASVLAIGVISAPNAQCEQAALAVSLAAATSQADADGTTALLSQLAARAETAVFGNTGYVLRGWFCGCGESCNPCVGTGAWTFDGAIESMGEIHCSWVRSGSTTCTRTGLTFWCCNSCSTTPYPKTCVELCGSTVPSGTPCDVTVCPP